jgi:hypothetical protein
VLTDVAVFGSTYTWVQEIGIAMIVLLYGGELIVNKIFNKEKK